jgi:glycosyltransferase involved in cell wall biosynthesis
LSRSEEGERLPGVAYHSFGVAVQELLDTRFRQWYGSWLHAKARFIPSSLKEIVEEVQPEVILTVWHRYSWLTAAELAREYNLPLHLIVHDDAPIVRHRAHPMFRSLYERDFRRVYRQAASRLCVSPYMEESYRERYGVEGQTLYPARGWEAPEYDAPPEHVKTKEGSVTVAYSGTLHTPGFKEALRDVADLLRDYDGELLIRSPLDSDTAMQADWARPNMTFRPFVAPKEIIPTLRADADILFLPTAFEGWAATKNQTNFPAKLTEYTATGLPLLVWGPATSSGVRWCREHSGMAEVVSDSGKHSLREALSRLVQEPDHRVQLGKRALEVGYEYFRAQDAWSTFRRALSPGSESEGASEMTFSSDTVAPRDE